MSILSDRQIAALSLQPTHIYDRPGISKQFFYRHPDGRFAELDDISTPVIYLHRHNEQYVDKLVRPIEVNDLADYRTPMLYPFEPKQVRERSVRLSAEDGYLEKIISYGLTSYGYDVRLGTKFKIFTNINSTVIDPMNMSDDCYVDFEGDVCIIPPHSYVLGHTIEYFRMPNDVVAVCLGKSTYARAGAAINVTPIEPGFEGQVVIEIANQTPLPMKVYANMGIAQFMFHRGERCMVSYGDRKGKYQGQQGVTTARV